MSDTRYLCVTVTEVSAPAAANLDRLITSLDGQGVDVDLVLVVRGGADTESPHARGRVTVHPLASPRVIALSAARNVALAHARRTALLDKADIVAFPDDDCRYGDGLLIRVASHLAGSSCAAVTGPYGPSLELVDRKRFPARPLTIDVSLVMRSISSSTMFFTAPLVAALGGFDERLGLGARFGSSEDSDYMIRTLAAGATAIYDPDLVVLHPYKANRPAEYYLGNVAVLAKHARGRVGIRLLLVRRLAGGVLLVLRSQMPFVRLRQSVSAARALLLERSDRPGAPDVDSTKQEAGRQPTKDRE